MEKLIKILNKEVSDAFEKCGYESSLGSLTVSDRPDLCQFQCNGALSAAKRYKKSPLQIANEILNVLKDSCSFKDISSAGPGFINLNVNDSMLADYLNMMNRDEKCGCDKADNPLTIIVDYGGANVAKPLHVGHIRAAVIGEAIKRISRFLGHNVIGDVHLGDWGLQIGMVITELRRRMPGLPYFDENYTGEYPSDAPFTISELEEIYPAASSFAKNNVEAMEKARKATLELQAGMKGYVALWKHILSVSVKDLKKVYGSLNVEFDLWLGESDCEKYIDKMVKYLKENNYTYESQGALVVDVAEEKDSCNIPPVMILKSDGSSLYSTTDIATIWQRVEDYDPDMIIYVVDKRQEMHFEQVFRCVKKAGIASENLSLEFIGFGTMNGKDGKPFKTREGGVMRLQDLIETIQSSVLDKLDASKGFSKEEMNDVSRKVGLSALKYGDLSNQITKDYVFDTEKFSSFEGNTGPYILYTIVRIKSILNKACSKEKYCGSDLIQKPYSQCELDLMLKLSKFNETIEYSFLTKTPNKLCEYMYDLSNAFNKFYHSNRIINEENQEKKNSWLCLSSLTKKVLETSVELLGIEVPDRM
ncbi:arginine--tRNA ligase [Sedimentibacter sp.]|uniref:arginine--tRNA ligase n=1 Tax=Sedimentibacter sp. TaxID=1960295 RepID=UPI0028AC9D5A|nr:arginine--tRNA ligase [Sedimentibacter sp.]